MIILRTIAAGLSVFLFAGFVAVAQIPERPTGTVKPPTGMDFPDIIPGAAEEFGDQLFYRRCAARPASCVWIVLGYENRIVNHTRQGSEDRRDPLGRNCFPDGLCRHASTQVRVLNTTGAAGKVSIYKSNRLHTNALVLETEFESPAGQEIRDHIYTDFNKFILGEARPESGWLAIFSTQPVLVSANVRVIEPAANSASREFKDDADALGYNPLKAFPVDCSSPAVFVQVCELFETERSRLAGNE